MWKKCGVILVLSSLVVLAAALMICGGSQQKPVIYAPNVRVILGAPYTAKDGVYALDSVDGDISAGIEVLSGTLNTQKVGRYPLRYKVTNSRGKSVRASRVVIVSRQSPAFFRTWIMFAFPAMAALFFCLAASCLFSRRRNGEKSNCDELH